MQNYKSKLKSSSPWRWIWRMRVRGLVFIGGVVLILASVDKLQFPNAMLRVGFLTSGLILMVSSVFWWLKDYKK